MKDILRILVAGYLIRQFLAPKIYPVIDEVIEQLPELPITLPEVEIPILPTEPKVDPSTIREELLVDKGQLIIEPELIYDEISYPRRRT